MLHVAKTFIDGILISRVILWYKNIRNISGKISRKRERIKKTG